MNNLDFDTRMKSALENLEVPYEPSTWASLEQLLSQSPVSDAAGQSGFDARMKSALENLEVPYEPSTWASLEQRLPRPAAPDAVDQAVFSTLNTLQAPYQSNHWDILAERMAHRTQLRRRIWAYKIAEAAVLLLLLLNLDGLLSGSAAPRSPQPTVPTRQSDKPIAEKQRRHQPATTNDLTTGSDNEQIATAQTSGMAATYPTAPLLKSEGEMSQFSGDQQIGLKNNAQSTATAPTVQAPQLNTSATTSTAARPVFAGLGPLPDAPYNLLAWEKTLTAHSVLPFATPASSQPNKAPKQRRFYASTIASLEKNRVKAQGADLQITPGYGGGLAAGYRKGKWGVEAGLAYSRREFSPRKEVKIVSGSINKGYYGAYVREVSADIVSVPVKATRRIARTGRLTAHAVAGLTANVAVEKAYQNKTVFYPGFQPQPGTDPLPKPTSLAQTGTGLLEGGKLEGNAYLNATVGLRLEHPISKRHTVFIEGTYNPALTRKGLGPKPAQINTLALNAGVMAGI